MEESKNCERCQNEYNLLDKQRIFLPCGDTICMACFDWSDEQERKNTDRLRKHLVQVKNERDEARRERDEARKQASTNAFALVGALMGDIETK